MYITPEVLAASRDMFEMRSLIVALACSSSATSAAELSVTLIAVSPAWMLPADGRVTLPPSGMMTSSFSSSASVPPAGTMIGEPLWITRVAFAKVSVPAAVRRTRA